MQISKEIQAAYELAKTTQKNAYAPYSNFQVGAGIKFKNHDEIFTGCNVENASIGATVCAERGAIQSAVAKIGKAQIEFIIVITNTDPAIGPCGLCLQVISEFAAKETPIYLANRKEIQSKVHFGDLLGSPFSKIPETINE